MSDTHPAAIIGAGPAGLTAAYELTRLGVPCEVYESDPHRVGGIARTDEYHGYRFDIGGHRFFSKSAEIRALWHEFLPDGEFLTVPRMSRIYYRNRFFDYPLRATNALRRLGLLESMRCMSSFAMAQARPAREAVSFEDWVTDRFGRRLFEIFFKTYTEKVWGMPCSEISADWAAQRIKGLSLYQAVKQSLVGSGRGEIVKTLIDEFEYPRLGPGMMWEHVRDRLESQDVLVHLGSPVTTLRHEGGLVRSIVVADTHGELEVEVDVSSVVSSMPLRSLVLGLDPAPPAEVLDAAAALRYRDFLTVILIIDEAEVFPDNWIYIHDPSVRLGRVQNFKNWSPDMVADPSRTCLGLEYFCFEGDELWRGEEDLLALGARELHQIGLVDPAKVVDGTVIRMPKAYPVYDHTYRTNVAIIRDYLRENLTNLELCGRNGMHKYNNQDHAMMTALMSARNIAGQNWDPWLVNDDAEYLEEEQVALSSQSRAVPQRIEGVVSR